MVVHADDAEAEAEAEAKAEAHAEAEADGKKNVKKRIETFVVGRDVEAGERVCWVVEGGKYKASFLLAEEGVDEWESRLLISEVSLLFLFFTFFKFWGSGGLSVFLLSSGRKGIGVGVLAGLTVCS